MRDEEWTGDRVEKASASAAGRYRNLAASFLMMTVRLLMGFPRLWRPWEDLRSMCPPGGELIALIEGVEFDPFLVLCLRFRLV